MTFQIQAVTHLPDFNVISNTHAGSYFIINCIINWNSPCYLFSQARLRETVEKNRVNPSSKSNTRPPETGENTKSACFFRKVWWRICHWSVTPKENIPLINLFNSYSLWVFLVEMMFWVPRSDFVLPRVCDRCIQVPLENHYCCFISSRNN